MSRLQSLKAVKDAIKGESFAGRINVSVESPGSSQYYKNIFVRVSYNIGYAQMDVSLVWEDDRTCKDYRQLGLHGVYNSNFQNFTNSNGTLIWRDGDNTISAHFNL